MIKKNIKYILYISLISIISIFLYKNYISKKTVIINDDFSIDKDSSNFTKNDIEHIIKDYILNNPNLIIESLEIIKKKKLSEAANKSTEFLKKNKDLLIVEGYPPILGNDKADISIIIFYDYNCSFCKKANIVINKLLKNDNNIKIILRPIAILGDTSMYAAKVSLALNKINKKLFHEMHNDLISLKSINPKSVKQLLKKYKIDYAIVENELNSYSMQKLIAKNFELAGKLGIKGAPSYIINEFFIPGFIDFDQFQKIIMQIRSS